MLNTRIITALLFAPLVVAGVLLLPQPLFAEVVMLLMIIGLFEWNNLTTHSNQFFMLGAMLVVVVAVGCYLAASGIIGTQVTWLLPIIALAGAIFWVVQYFTLAKGIEYKRSKSFEMSLGLVATLCAWSAMVWLRIHHETGSKMVLIAIMVVFAADTFAYFVGVQFGKRKLASSISPGKTIEGAIGGMAGAVLVATVSAYYFLDYQGNVLLRWVVAATAAAATSVVGDLYISRLKRQAGVKDSGKLLPGHGGILDRIDGLIAAMPVFAAVWWILL